MWDDFDDRRYKEQQRALNDIASRFGAVAFRPDYHRKARDHNTVLFYTVEDAKFNMNVDRQAEREGTRGYSRSEAHDLKWVPDYLIYKDYFWSFSNDDQNGAMNLNYANFGKLDLRSSHWEEVLEGSIRLALASKRQREYIANTGGYLELREADEFYNDLNREKIAAMKMLHGRAFLMDVNYYDEKRAKIVAGEESIYEEVLDQEIYNFSGSYCVPRQDTELEEMVRRWNSSDDLPKKWTDIEAITDRVEAIGGIILIWY